jgi:hypothetical protein
VLPGVAQSVQQLQASLGQQGQAGV